MSVVRARFADGDVFRHVVRLFGRHGLGLVRRERVEAIGDVLREARELERVIRERAVDQVDVHEEHAT